MAHGCEKSRGKFKKFFQVQAGKLSFLVRPISWNALEKQSIFEIEVKLKRNLGKLEEAC